MDSRPPHGEHRMPKTTPLRIALIAAAAAKKVGRTNPRNYHGMLRLDHNRAASQLAKIGRAHV